METILLLAHTEPEGWLPKAAFEALSAAHILNSKLGESRFVVGLIGGSVKAAADQLAGCGATRFLAIEGSEFAQSRYCTDADAVEAICKRAEASIVVAPATTRWNRVLAGVAQRLGGRIDTHITGVDVVDGKIMVTRWYYRQRMEAALTRKQRPWFILTDPGSQPAWQGGIGKPALEFVPVQVNPEKVKTEVIGVRQPAGEAQTIRPEAKLLFVAGAGWTKKQADGLTHVKDAEQIIADCLRVSSASLGSTKSLVDLSGDHEAALSFLSHFNQVGQTGSTPRHPKGLATCCHGEEPHTIGWRFINERRAINLDPNCGWARGKADVLYVANAFEVIRKLNALLSPG